MHLKAVSVLAVFLLSLSAAAQDAPDARLQRVLTDSRFGAAMAAIDRDHDRLVSEIVKLTEIPAPPFM
jgi:hypothetical protein